MSKTVGLVARPGFVDLTRGPSNFQPHAGAKKLIIKNLRITSRADLVEYYEKTWGEVDDALSAVFREEDPSVPLEVLCRGVEAICRHGRAEKLFVHLKERCKTYLEKQLLPIVEREGAGTNVDALRAVWRFWSLWNEQSVRSKSAVGWSKANTTSRP
jgi:cullin-4